MFSSFHVHWEQRLRFRYVSDVGKITSANNRGPVPSIIVEKVIKYTKLIQSKQLLTEPVGLLHHLYRLYLASGVRLWTVPGPRALFSRFVTFAFFSDLSQKKMAIVFHYFLHLLASKTFIYHIFCNSRSKQLKTYLHSKLFIELSVR